VGTGASEWYEQHAGAFGFYTEGRRLPPKTGEEIIAIARETEFIETRRLVRSYGDGNETTYVPRALIPDAIAQAALGGLLGYKLGIAGKSAPGPRALPIGTYYLWVDWLEGRWAGKGEGNWVGRMIGEDGGEVCTIFGIRFNQVAHFGTGHGDAHSYPSITIHGLSDSRLFGPLAEQEWADYQVDWKPFGLGCWKTTLCVPAGPT
jgi:hypothetical protein